MKREGCGAAGGEGVEEGRLGAKTWRRRSDDRLRREGGQRGGSRPARFSLRAALLPSQSVAAVDAWGTEGEGGNGRDGECPRARAPARSQPHQVSPSAPSPSSFSGFASNAPSSSASSCCSPPASASTSASASYLHQGHRRRSRRCRRRSSSSSGPFEAVSIATAAAAGAEASTAGTTVPTAAGVVASRERGITGPGKKRGLEQRVVASVPSAAADRDGAAPKKDPLWRRLRRTTTGSTTTTTTTDSTAGAGAAAAAAAAPETGLAEFVRSFSGGSRRRGLVEDVLKVVVWSFFAERLVQSALVGWGQSGRVAPIEQLGGTLIEADPSDARYVETRAVLRGVRMGRDTVHLNTARASPEMFTKLEVSEVRFPSSTTPRAESSGRRQGERGDDGSDSAEASEQGGADAADEDEARPLLFHEYAAPAFAHLRGLYGMSSSEYRRSFREGSRMIAHASNSKSAQSFMFTEDGKYMLKTASESELDSMLRLLPRYAEHVARRRGSLITRFYGIYRVTEPTTKRSTVFVSSSNVFSTEKRLHERYDLKGSVVGRRTISPKEGGAVAKPTTILKDLDLADGEKIQLAAGCKKRLLAELSADAEFLADLGVMDYSLLVSPPPFPRPATAI
eukprot:g12895.t1